jgi:hypothetical protein
MRRRELITFLGAALAGCPLPLGPSTLVLSEEVYRHVPWTLRQKGRNDGPSGPRRRDQ